MSKVKDYKYFARLFGDSNTSNLLQDLDEDIRQVKKSLWSSLKLRDDPVELFGTLERKEEFKQDVIFGNTIRREYTKHGKPPIPLTRPKLEVNRNVLKMQITADGACISESPSFHEVAVQTTDA